MFVAIIIALLTATFTYYATDRSKRKAQLIIAKSTLIKNIYLLQQVWSNRLQSELKAYYYEARKNLSNDTAEKSLFAEMEKNEALQQPSLAIAVSKAYGDIIHTGSIVQLLATSESYSLVSKTLNELGLSHKSLFINDIDKNDKTNITKVEEYNQQGYKTIEAVIDKEMKGRLTILQKNLENVRLRWL